MLTYNFAIHYEVTSFKIATWTAHICISTQLRYNLFLPLHSGQCVFFRGCLTVFRDLAASGCRHDRLRQGQFLPQKQKSRWCTVNSSVNLMLNIYYTT